MIHHFENFELSEAEFELRTAGRRVAIQPKPLRLLIHLVRNRHRLVSRDELMETVWRGENVSRDSLDRAVRAVRRSLGDDRRSERFVRTVRGVGYRFVAEVGTRAASPPPPGGLEVAALN